jgi:hypothetical protein
MRREADADKYMDILVWPARGQRERVHRGRGARPSRLRLLWLVLLAAAVAATIGAAAFTFTRPTDEAVASAAERELLIVTQAGPAGVSLGSASSSPGPSATPVRRRPVAGLNQAAMDNAVAIVEVGKQMNLPRRAYLVATMTALQESMLRNLANSTVPQSLNYPHQGVERNYDSLGLFQQRASQGWGTVAQLMDPRASARLFYRRLLAVSGWQSMSPGDAAQAVQRSAFPDEYDKQQGRAQQIINAIG